MSMHFIEVVYGLFWLLIASDPNTAIDLKTTKFGTSHQLVELEWQGIMEVLWVIMGNI